MNLEELRNKIDDIDKEILSAFEKRMELCRNVAKYKIENNIPVFQSGREKEIISKVTAQSPSELKNGSAALFTELMDISKCIQQQELLKGQSFITPYNYIIDTGSKVYCQGLPGSNSEAAARLIFPSNQINFCSDFENVFEAVETENDVYGILPIHNSTAGSVTQTYDLLKKHNVFIAQTVKLEISHCLAAKKETKADSIKKVYSHPQALSQCSSFLKSRCFITNECLNTANAAEFVSVSPEPIAAVCSEECAKLYGLEIIQRNISNIIPNFTKFICITKEFCISDNSNTMSVILSLPNSAGSLYRLLTKFFVNGLNLVKIESRPAADGSFDVMFYLDFEGNINDQKVSALLLELSAETEQFKFLGNF